MNKVEFTDTGFVPVVVSYRLALDDRGKPCLEESARCEALNWESESLVLKPSFPNEDSARCAVLCWSDNRREGLSGTNCAVRVLGAEDGWIRFEVMAKRSEVKA